MRSANHSELSNALLAISQSLADRSQLTQTLDAVLTAARQMTSQSTASFMFWTRLARR